MMEQPGPPANNKKLDKLKPTTILENWAMGLIELGAQSRETKEVRPKTILELRQKPSSKPQRRDPSTTQCHLLKGTEVSPQAPDPEKQLPTRIAALPRVLAGTKPAWARGNSFRPGNKSGQRARG